MMPRPPQPENEHSLPDEKNPAGVHATAMAPVAQIFGATHRDPGGPLVSTSCISFGVPTNTGIRRSSRPTQALCLRCDGVGPLT